MHLFSTLETERLLIRRFESRDIKALLAYRNDPDVACYQSWELPYSRHAATAFALRMGELSPGEPGQGFQFALGLRPSGGLIGDCGLQCDAREPRLASLDVSVAVGHQTQGYGREASVAVLDYAFRKLLVHRVQAVTDDRNLASVRLLESLGFRLEGHMLDSRYRRGAWASEYVFGMLAHEWAARPT